MFEQSFQRATAAGARLLFLIAVVVFLGGVLEGLLRIVGTAGARAPATWLRHVEAVWSGLGSGWSFFIGDVLRALANAALPLFGALLVDRLDRLSHLRRRGSCERASSRARPDHAPRRIDPALAVRCPSSSWLLPKSGSGSHRSSCRPRTP